MAYTTIDDPSAYFHVQLYSGDGGSSNAITNDANAGDFKPDWTWIKERSSTSSHQLIDSSRGDGALYSDNDGEEDFYNSGFYFTENTDGFTLGSNNGVNQSSQTYVAWQWKANGGTTTSNGASGDIKASVTQREDTAKFAICTYTGTGINAGQSHRVNHGLGTTPHVMIFKNRGAGSTDWVVYHHKNTDAPETDYLVLNTDAATADSANKFNDTAPNTSYATIGGDDNISSNTMVLYSFAEVQGYSKFGSYVGNGGSSAARFDGPFVYTGFKPAWIMTKRSSSSGGSWAIVDNKRDTINPTQIALFANTNGADDTDKKVDFLSNGFKLRNSRDDFNTDGVTYVYMAFAKHPFVSSEGVPVTAK